MLGVMLAEVKRCLNEYEENFRHPGLPPLELKGMYALFPEEGAMDSVESQWGEPYPNADRMGVYLVFGQTGTLIYVGKASLGTTIGGRLGTYFAGKKECRLLTTDWAERPAYIATIAVPPDSSFEAAALAEYIIERLRPVDNELGLPRVLVVETPAPEPAPAERSTAEIPAGSNVYTYSAPGMPMCPNCGQRPDIFYCSTHKTSVCLECVARHDVPGTCVYLPAYRAPKPAEAQALSGADKTETTGRPRSILGI